MSIARVLWMAAGVAALAPALCPTAGADEDSGWYAGFSAGQARARIADRRIVDGLLGAGFTTTSITDQDLHFGYKAYGGYEFNRYFSMEGGYFDLGRFGFRADTLPVGQLHGDIRLKGANVDLVGRAPLGDRFALLARIGVDYADARDSFDGSGAVAVIDSSPHRWAANYKFGVGGEFKFTRALAMRVEAERYRIDDAVGHNGDVDLYSAGLVYRFGRTQPPPPAPPPVAAAPVMAPVPEPPPPPAPPPAPPVRQRVSFSADSLFDFAKDTIRPAGQRALDTFAAQLRGAQFDVIEVTGHTDRLGSRAYNEDLSTRRAEAVKSYLVANAGIPPDKVHARGADGSDPVTAPGACRGEKRTATLIACLQPDRRVEVEVVGSRLQAAP